MKTDFALLDGPKVKDMTLHVPAVFAPDLTLGSVAQGMKTQGASLGPGGSWD
jgi:hypothetical protein